LRKQYVFDLDDTLYREIDFVRSGFRFIAHELQKLYGFDCAPLFSQALKDRNFGNVFQEIIKRYSLPQSTMDFMLSAYRYHYPDIQSRKNVIEVLESLSVSDGPLLCITDGRSLTQRQKLHALRVDQYFANVFISEETGYSKPDYEIYELLMENHPAEVYYYIGDNPSKDFVMANKLDWKTIGIFDDGEHIHSQNDQKDEVYQPHYWVNDFFELQDLIGEL